MPAPASRSHDPAAVRQQAAALIAVRILLYLGGMSSYFIGVLGTLTFTLGGGVFDNAIAVGLLNLFMTFGSMQSGTLLDRLGMRAHFRICASSLVVIGLLYQVLARSVPGLYLGAALFGYAMGAADVIPRSYPAYLTDRVDELKRINSGITVATNVSIIVGPLVGGAIATVAPTQTVFLFMTACSLLAFVPAAVMRPLRTLRQGSGKGGKDRPDALYGFKSIRSSRVLNLLFWCTMLSFLGYGAFDPLESLFYRDVLRVGASWMGWLSALSGVGGIVGAFAVGAIPRHHVNVRTLLTVLALSGGGSLLYVSTSDVRHRLRRTARPRVLLRRVRSHQGHAHPGAHAPGEHRARQRRHDCRVQLRRRRAAVRRARARSDARGPRNARRRGRDGHARAHLPIPRQAQAAADHGRPGAGVLWSRAR